MEITRDNILELIGIPEDHLIEILKSIGILEDDLNRYVEFLKKAFDDNSKISGSINFGALSDEQIIRNIVKSIHQKEILGIVNDFYYDKSDNVVEKYEPKVLALNDCFLSLEFVKRVKGADISAHENIVINSGNLEYIIRFAKEVEGADIEKLKNAIIKSNDVFYAYKFALNIKRIDIKELENIVIESKNLKYNYLFAKDVIHFDVDIEAHRDVVIESNNPEYNYLFAKDIKGNSENIKEHADVVIESKDPEYNYLFAKDVNENSENIKKHANVVIESKNLKYNYLFARDIGDADIQKHIDVLLNSENFNIDDAEYIYQFTKELDKWKEKCNFSYSDILPKCKNAIIKCKNPKYIYLFAKDIDRVNILEFMNALLDCHASDTSKYIYRFIMDLRKDSLMNKRISDDNIKRCLSAIIESGNPEYNYLAARNVDIANIYDHIYAALKNMSDDNYYVFSVNNKTGRVLRK